MKLSDYLDKTLLDQHIRDRVVNVAHHPALPLDVLNYSRIAQFTPANEWTDVMRKCRGLIVDKTNDEIVATSFRKFWNLGTNGLPETNFENLPVDAPEITVKEDGSLILLYRYKGFVGLATRGSFVSDQATWASNWYHKHVVDAKYPEGWTPVFEVVYPENRIVVKYDYEGLILLGMVNNETGEELPYSELAKHALTIGVPVAGRVNAEIAAIRVENKPNAEGYVLTWPKPGQPPLKIKIKFTDYVRLHRLLTSISPKRIWEMLRDGESFDELMDDTPEHYRTWVNMWKNEFESKFGRIEQKALAIYASCPLPKHTSSKEDRKALAEYFTNGDIRKLSAVLFKLEDRQPYDGIIWKMIKPKGEDCFRSAEE